MKKINYNILYRLVFLFLTSVVTLSPLVAQRDFSPAFAKDMIQLCNSFTFLDLYGTDEAILPKGYEKYYTSGVFGMDNKFQIYTKDQTAYFVFRGSTDKKISWMENILSSMIPSTGQITIEGEVFDYKFAKDTAAHVHAGYALGVAYLHKDLLFHIGVLNKLGYQNIVITGHSQGGSLANIVRAYLENLPAGTFKAKNTYTTYAFAAPMIGNKELVNEYNKRFCANGTSYNIVNPEDMIPRLPSHFNEGENLVQSLMSMMSGGQEGGKQQLLMDAGYHLFGDMLTQKVQGISGMITEQIVSDLGVVKLPPYTADINYYPVGNVIYLPVRPYPYEVVDSIKLARGEEPDAEEDRKKKTGFQHKPYNYYVSILEKFFPREYDMLDRKFLMENL